jgi:hypothetical protein
MTTPEDVYAARFVLDDVSKEATEGFGFEHAISMRRALLDLISTARQTLSDVESEMVRQVEKHAKTIDGVTYTRSARKSVTTDHERLLSMAYQRALQEATQPDGNVDWEALGEYFGNIMVSLYLSPSTTPKATGLKFLGVGKKQVTTESITGWQLGVYGEED